MADSVNLKPAENPQLKTQKSTHSILYSENPDAANRPSRNSSHFSSLYGSGKNRLALFCTLCLNLERQIGGRD
jgi:hypothetical protein